MAGRRIRGEGPLTGNPPFVAGEYPGRDEARSGRPFMGKTGKEIDRYFDGIRLPARDDVYLTDWIKEWEENGEYTAAMYDRDLPEFVTEIKACRPTLVIPLGRAVARLFLGDIDMEEVHGIPWTYPPDSPARAHGIDFVQTVFPIYNPAAGFRSPELSALVAYDFAQLQAFLEKKLTPRRLFDDPIPNPQYIDVVERDMLDSLMGVWVNPVIDGYGMHVLTLTFGCDTEGWPWLPWSVQLTPRDGVGYVIRVSNAAILARFVELVNAHPHWYHFIFHNSLHDLAVFRALGIDTTRLSFDDTMVMAYNLQLEPQGLKPLATRHCGMEMDSYESLMGDLDERFAVDWLLNAYQIEEFEYEESRKRAFDVERAKGRRLKVLPKLPRPVLFKAIERCLKSKRPRGLWTDQVLDLQLAAKSKYGEMWSPTLDHVPLDQAIHYAGRDPDATHRVAPVLREALSATDSERVYQADLGTIPLIDRMQQVGIRPDLAHFERLSDDLGFELLEIRARMAEQLVTQGYSFDDAFEFNANSTYQVGELLYDRFGLEVLKRTPAKDPSTNDKILEALEEAHPEIPIIGDIREYREVYKLKHTFCEAIPDFVRSWPHDGRIHATFRITRVVSGRLACTDPNLLALPKHGKFAKRFRAGFIPKDGALFGEWDLSQIELRVLAHLSQDPILLDAFRTGKDLHAALAERIFGVKPKDQDKSKHRLPAKAINFGIPMGMTYRGLTIELKKNGLQISEDDAARWLQETMDLYKLVPTYQQDMIAEARRTGFVTDLMGRRRYCGGIRSWDDGIRQEAERFAFSTPIQAGAQEIMKKAEYHIWHDIILPIQREGGYLEPILQVHDAIDEEMTPDLLSRVDEAMIWAMTETFEGLSVPIETSGDAGYNLGDLHEIACLYGRKMCEDCTKGKTHRYKEMA